MHRFWDTIIAPILELVQPSSIIEIGSDQGHNTAKLLEFCKQHGATLHAIDPLPRFDVAAWREQYGQQFVFHQSLSLNALPKVNRFDVVLIDGDHNWYTVFHELKLIEKRSAELSRPFPLVMLHDIGWPYGRRDLYYNPENIPDAYRKPYKKKGLRPGIAELQEKGGLNTQLDNAVYEHNLQNGVLTAVEDFLKEAEQELELSKLPGLHGLGIITPVQLKGQNEKLAKFLEVLDLSPTVARYVEKIEEARLDLDITRLEYRDTLQQLEVERKKQIENLQKEQQVRADALQVKEAEASKLQQQLGDSQQVLSATQDKLAAAEAALEQARTAHQAERERREAEASKLQQQDVAKLIRWIEQLDHGITDIWNSKRWRLGHALGALYRKVRFKPPMPMPQDYYDVIMKEFQVWKKNAVTSNGSIRPIDARQSSAVTKQELSSQSPKKKVLYSIEVKQRLEAKRSKDSTPPHNINLILYTNGQCESLRRTFLSLRHNTDLSANFLYLVDDSQDLIVAQKITEWAEGVPSLEVIRPDHHLGFYQSVRSVIDRIRMGDFCILWGTVVLTPEWLSGLKEAAYSSRNVGIVSPLTSGHPCYEFRMNPGDNVMSCACKLRFVSAKEYPVVAVPDMNIFYIKREALRSVPFPDNQDDSTDKTFIHFVLGLYRKNFLSILADDTFIYTSQRFRQCNGRAFTQIVSRMNAEDQELITQLVDYTQQTEIVSIQNYQNSEIRLVNPLTLGVLYANIIIRGGVLILTEMTNDLILDGVDTKGILLHDGKYERERFDLLFEPITVSEAKEILPHLPDHSSIMATFWTTARLAEQVATLNPTIHAHYFIQDFEPFFYNTANPEERTYYEGACASYSYSLQHLTTSDWIVSQVRNFLGKPDHPIRKLGYGINTELFYTDIKVQRSEKVRVIAMARPTTPRRGFADLIKTLSLVHQQDPAIEFVLFGTDDLSKYSIPFPFSNVGLLNPERLRLEYSKADIFIDTSLFQGYGLAALEAMACGCACVLTDSGGASEYAENEINALVVPPRDCQAAAQAILRLTRDVTLRKKLQVSGQLTAKKFTNHDVGRDVLRILEAIANERARLVEQRCADATCNIIVPVYNEPAVVRRCLESIVQHTNHPYQVIIVDDCSDDYTAALLKKFAQEHPHFFYIRNEQNRGFIGSVNGGMAATESGDIVLLNSDTIVTPGWLEKIVRCAQSDDRIGIISPLTTFSSHLWMKLNPGDSIFAAAKKIEQLSDSHYPDVVTPEGWCFFIKRKVYEYLEGFDPIYGQGYCEESDYSMRAYVNGHRLVCCDDTFIFHQGRMTFKEERSPRYATNREIFDRRWKPLYSKIYREFLAQDPLFELRRRYAASVPRGFVSAEQANKFKHDEVIDVLHDKTLPHDIDEYKRTLTDRLEQKRLNPASPPRIVFLLSVLQEYGGVISVTQLVNDLILAGIDAKIVVINPQKYNENLFLLTEPILFSGKTDLLEHFPEADLVIGTLWITMYYIVKLCLRDPNLIPAYFVQDFEPYFYPEMETGLRRRITETYQLTPYCFAKTGWICELVRQVGGEITEVPPALDLELFYPRPVSLLSKKRVVLAMLRPSTPRRGFETMVQVFSELFSDRDDFELHTFGADDEELAQYRIPFPFTNHGKVPQASLPELYSQSYLFVEFSDFHGFGRTIAEAMACETACVITDSGGVSLFAIDGENCLIAPPTHIDALQRNISRGLDDPGFRDRLAENGRRAVMKFDRYHSAEETLKFLERCLFRTRPELNGEQLLAGRGQEYVDTVSD